MPGTGLEAIVMVVILVGLAISQLVELVFKPILLDAGIVLPDNYRKIVIFVLLAALGVIAAAGLDLDFAGEYLVGLDPILTALVSAAGYAGVASASHDLLKRLRGEVGDDPTLDILLPTLEYMQDVGEEVFGAESLPDEKDGLG